MNPKISVITVCFNTADCIEKTILSVINQTYQNIEYIIIDGGSTDGTLDIIRKYAGHICYWVSEPDKGIYDAMNKGIAKATGDYINFMNAGDSFISSEVLPKVISYLGEEDIISGNEIAIRNEKIEDYTKSPQKINFEFLCNDCLRHQATFIKTSLLKQTMYDTTLKIAADWKFWFVQLLINKCSYKAIDVDICLFSRNGISTIDTANQGSKERRIVIHEYMGDKGVFLYDKNRNRTFITYLIYRVKRWSLRRLRLLKYRKHLSSNHTF